MAERRGTSVIGERSEDVFSDDEREELEGRLRDLGYTVVANYGDQ